MLIEQKSENTAIDLGVEVSGIVITVRAGAFKAGGEDLELEDDVSCTVETRENNVWLDGHLVKEIASGEVTVLVDEQESDGVVRDSPYVWEGSPYERLGPIFSMGVPGGTTDLTGLELNVNKTTIPEPKPKPEPEPEPEGGE